jgi:iron complex transport system substrate-binding protein
MLLFANQKIVALSPAINEIIFALGGGDLVVGNTTFCDYPKESIDKPKVGGYFSPSLEKIISLKPDIVIMQKNNANLAPKLNHFGIKTKVIEIDRLDNIKNSIEYIGTLINKDKKAKELLTQLEISLNSTKDIVTNKKILIVIGHNLSLDSKIFVVGQNLYLDDIISYSGNQNALIQTRKGQPILNLEGIIATNPDIVIVLAPYMKDKKLTKDDLIAPWLKLPINATKQKDIYIVDGRYAGVASDRLILFLKDYKRFLENVRDKKLQ